jgi:HlyD family secretion protein
MKRKRRVTAAVVLLLALGGGLLLWTSRHSDEINNRIVLYGNVDIRQVELAFNGNDRIDRVLAQEGDVVRKGQLLASLETARLLYAVDLAKARVMEQGQVVARLIAGSRPEEVRKARADVAAAEAEFRTAEEMYRRTHLLREQDLASQQKEDDARAASDTAEARLKAAKEALKLTVKGPRKEDIESAKSRLKMNESELAIAERELSNAYLLAPSDGVIQVRIMEPGEMASPLKPVYTLAMVDPVWVRVYLPEPDLGTVRPGMKAEISTDSYPGKVYRGWIGFISPTAQFTPKTVETTEVRTNLVYQARVFVCNPQNELRLGMPATVTIPLDQHNTNGSLEEGRCGEPDETAPD